MAMRTFTTVDPALPMTYPGFVFRSLVKDGHSPEALLAKTGLTAERLTDPEFRCGFASLHRLLVNSLAETSDPHLGPRLALKFEPNFIGLPAYAAMNAACFRNALDVLNRFFFLTFPAIDFAFPDDMAALGPGEVALRLRPRIEVGGDLAYFVSGSALVACDCLCRAILRTDMFALHAEARVGEPAGWSTVASEIGLSIRFDAEENRLVFPEALLKLPLPGADPLNHSRLVGLCEQFAAKAGTETTLIGRVVALLDQGRMSGATLKEAAGKLGYSERGLRRELERSGTSFRELVETVRKGRARTMLADTERPIQAIAYDLGFDSPSNFARSFKRWTGVSPKAFREGQGTRREPGRN